MRQFSTPSILAQSENPVKFYLIDGETCYNTHTSRVRQKRRNPDRASTRAGLLTPTSERTLRIMSATSPILPEPHTDATPEFDTPRLIQRVDALSYSLPMLAPDGARCMVTLTGDFAAWGAVMRALVREGFDYAPPTGWQMEGER